MYFKGIWEGKFFIFSEGYTQSRGGQPEIPYCGSCHNIQFKPYATFNMEVFVTKNR